MKIDGVKDFSFEELSKCTSDFSDSTLIGQGGYGKVYKGVLADGTVAAIKRAQEGSLQGSKEFFTEIELLSRLHHRNLVSLLGYCDEEDEQVFPPTFDFYKLIENTNFNRCWLLFKCFTILEWAVENLIFMHLLKYMYIITRQPISIHQRMFYQPFSARATQHIVYV
jgi:serine/threonine protein kinase